MEKGKEGQVDAQMKLIFSNGGQNFYFANEIFEEPGLYTWDSGLKKNVRLWPRKVLPLTDEEKWRMIHIQQWVNSENGHHPDVHFLLSLLERAGVIE